ncbi:hypothetical protein BSZ35_08840 [Salinibacter sp. 10B]|uniref:type IX secretion system protein PorQ n=1 Tax=Salinibacter sp. 10B TaxID=1923971 RepID=UPI000CF3C563|nr:type IX secretion system protein PorQ [Salinibacter sp. 10B]PQJ34691.1 hypothetical protein BSZ35_08840 [Salinibacter sp. 10B]
MPFARIRALGLLLLCMTAPVCGQPGADLTSFPVLRLEPSARTAAMGGAFAAVADGDVNVLFFNPAVPDSATSRQISFSYTNHLADLNAGSVAYSRTLPAVGMTMSGGLRFLHAGTFEGRDRYGEPTGDFGAGDIVLTAGLSRALGPRFRYGANTHLLYSQIDDVTASVLAADLGGVYHLPSRQLAVGVTLRNLGVTLTSFDGTSEDLPLDLQVGLSKRLAHLPLLLTVTGYDLTNPSKGVEGGDTFDHVLSHLTFGAEVQPGDVLRLRVGYNHRRSRDLALTDRFDLAGLGMGFGLTVSALTVDYAYNSWSSLGGLHQFTLRTDLSSL